MPSYNEPEITVNNDDDYWYDLRTQDMPKSQIILMETIGYDAYERLVAEFGGTTIYIPTVKTVALNAIKRHIIADYFVNGLTVKLICDKYGVEKGLVYKTLMNHKRGLLNEASSCGG